MASQPEQIITSLSDVDQKRLRDQREWIMVEDANGRDPAVRVPNTTIILYPMTMISKRIERGESVDVFELYNSTAEHVEHLKVKAR